jgi:hypothetical protein
VDYGGAHPALPHLSPSELADRVAASVASWTEDPAEKALWRARALSCATFDTPPCYSLVDRVEVRIRAVDAQGTLVEGVVPVLITCLRPGEA